MNYIPQQRLAKEADELLESIEAENKDLTPKDRKEIPLQEMPAQNPALRVKNMSEVALGYTENQAKLEALRCLQCKKAPCIEGCPVAIDIPGFISAIAEEKWDQAIDIIKENSLLPAVCGRVCPQEIQCQAKCTLGRALKDPEKSVSIGRLERFVADRARAKKVPDVGPKVGQATAKKVAVIGSGPAGVTVAADVRRAGHAVTMFEAFHKPGGVLMYGIPEFRLPKEIVKEEINTLINMGVEVRTNYVVGKTRMISALREQDGFDAVFIGTGAGLPRFMGIEGENLVGVFSANEYLTRANLMRAYDREKAITPIYRSRKIAVLGGGNVAMDAARMARRIGAEEVHLVYRRTETEMPARIEEVRHAKEEGIHFHLLQNAKRIVGDADGRVCALQIIRYELGEPDQSGRRRPVEIPGSEFQMNLDTVIVAIGNESNPLIKQTTEGLEVDKWGNILVNKQCQTSLEGVYAGGDIVLGAATVILAMGQGRVAAAAINDQLG